MKYDSEMKSAPPKQCILHGFKCDTIILFIHKYFCFYFTSEKKL